MEVDILDLLTAGKPPARSLNINDD